MRGCYQTSGEAHECVHVHQCRSVAGQLAGPSVQSFARLPERVSHREAFVLEGGWLPAPGRMERLIWRYDASGRRAAYP